MKVIAKIKFEQFKHPLPNEVETAAFITFEIDPEGCSDSKHFVLGFLQDTALEIFKRNIKVEIINQEEVLNKIKELRNTK